MIRNGKRELAYIKKIDWIRPIEGADNIELVGIMGWTCIAKKGEFKVDDLCVYFEIDSKLPEENWTKFMEAKHYKVKTMKLSKFKVISQGLALPLGELSDYFKEDLYSSKVRWIYNKKYINSEGKEEVVVNIDDPVTDYLNVKYSVVEDNKRKTSNDKYTSMVQRHQKLFKNNKIIKWLYKRNWGKKLLFLFLGKKQDSKRAFPTHFPYIHHTDEERVENLVPAILENKQEWIQTLKIDGTSATYILEKKKFGKYEFYVTSRNVRQLTPDQECFHERNVYWEMEKKYNIQEVLKKLLESHPSWTYVCIQGEIAGEGVQGNPHKIKDTNFYAFNFIDSEKGRWNSEEARNLLDFYNISFVPIISTHYILPDTIEELKAQAEAGEIELEEGCGDREGYVYRDKEGQMSFKNVSNKYLLKRGE